MFDDEILRNLKQSFLTLIDFIRNEAARKLDFSDKYKPAWDNKNPGGVPEERCSKDVFFFKCFIDGYTDLKKLIP